MDANDQRTEIDAVHNLVQTSNSVMGELNNRVKSHTNTLQRLDAASQHYGSVLSNIDGSFQTSSKLLRSLENGVGLVTSQQNQSSENQENIIQSLARLYAKVDRSNELNAHSEPACPSQSQSSCIQLAELHAKLSLIECRSVAVFSRCRSSSQHA